MKSRPYDVQGPSHPVQDEIKKFVGQYRIIAEVEEDKTTLALLDYVPGLVSFLCTLRDSDGRILSQGRGSAVLNKTNRMITKVINMAFGSSFVDASVRCKVLDTLRSGGSDTHVITADMPELATDRQKQYLHGLIQSRVSNTHSRDQMESELEQMTKVEAREKIKFLVESR
jgi:hypothetical protein